MYKKRIDNYLEREVSLITPLFGQKKDIEWIDRGWYLVTEFEKTSSVNFTRAVELASSHPGFIRLMDERNVLIYRNLYRPEDILQFQELAPVIKNWRTSKCYINGDPVDFDMLGSGISCYGQTVLDARASGQEPACAMFTASRVAETARTFGFLGCRRSQVTMDWSTSLPTDIIPWFVFGRLDPHQVYRVEKDAIERTLIDHLIEFHYCPLLDMEGLKTFVRHTLPDRIDPRKDREWRYRKTLAPDALEGNHQPAVMPISEAQYRTYLIRTFQSPISR